MFSRRKLPTSRNVYIPPPPSKSSLSCTILAGKRIKLRSKNGYVSFFLLFPSSSLFPSLFFPFSQCCGKQKRTFPSFLSCFPCLLYFFSSFFPLFIPLSLFSPTFPIISFSTIPPSKFYLIPNFVHPPPPPSRGSNGQNIYSCEKDPTDVDERLDPPDVDEQTNPGQEDIHDQEPGVVVSI